MCSQRQNHCRTYCGEWCYWKLEKSLNIVCQLFYHNPRGRESLSWLWGIEMESFHNTNCVGTVATVGCYCEDLYNHHWRRSCHRINCSPSVLKQWQRLVPKNVAFWRNSDSRAVYCTSFRVLKLIYDGGWTSWLQCNFSLQATHNHHLRFDIWENLFDVDKGSHVSVAREPRYWKGRFVVIVGALHRCYRALKRKVAML